MILKTKKCSKCKDIKSIDEFYINNRLKSGYKDSCKNCTSSYQKEYYKKNKEKCKNRLIKWKIKNPDYNKNYYKNNLEKIKKELKIWRKNNPDKMKIIAKRYRDNNYEKEFERKKIWNKNNPEYKKEWEKNNKDKRSKYTAKVESKIEKRLSRRLSRAIWQSLKGNKNGKHWENLVGYLLEDLIIHLESLFKTDMNWFNYGRGGWSIDHIRPISSFNFSSYDDPEFKKCWALENLQPLWESENIRKGNKIEYVFK